MLSTTHLKQACLEDMERFKVGCPLEVDNARELFRRAIEDKDWESWEALTWTYNPLVLSWLRRAGVSTWDIEELAQMAWIKFWRSFTMNHLGSADSGAAILAYLKRCTKSVALDQYRSSPPIPLDIEDEAIIDRATASPETIVEAVDAQPFWGIIRRACRSTTDITVVSHVILAGMKPQQLADMRPDLFPHVGVVYQTKRLLLDRLKRNQELHAWLREKVEA